MQAGLHMIAFTLCSNNYLSKALVLAESFERLNPASLFLIGIVDRPHPKLSYPSTESIRTIFVEDLNIPSFAAMLSRYSLIELNTAIKPFFFKHIIQQSPSTDNLIVCYFDPDIRIFQPLTPIQDALRSASIVLTPHILSPIPLDGKRPEEHAFLNYGLYNLGFCGLRYDSTSSSFLDWWCSRLHEHCRDDVKIGLFVDQLWVNFAPIFFANVHVSRHPGLNVSYWNLHERNLTTRDGVWMVNEKWPLVFYHFSSFSLEPSNRIGRPTNTRFSMEDRPEMRQLFQDYRNELLARDATDTSSIACALIPETRSSQSFTLRLARKFRRGFSLLKNLRHALS